MLFEISFQVSDGEFCVLLGPSGCGKTTLLRLIAGLEEPSTGSISIGSKCVDRLPPRERDVAFVFQSYALYPHMTVFENLAFSLRLRGMPEREIRHRVLETARLLEVEQQLQYKPQQLSGGQRQRVALGRAIVRQPKIFLFDEPLSNLDASLRASMRLELAELHRKLQATILYVTHDQAEAMTLGEEIMVLNEGRLQQMASPSIIYHKPANTFVAGFVGSPRMNLIDGRLDEKGLLRMSRGTEIDLARLWKRWREYVAKTVIVGIRPEDLSLTAGGAGWIQGEVEIVEDLGSDKFVHLKFGEAKLVARASARLSPHRGDILCVEAESSRVHFFHQEKRIDES